MKYFFVPGRKWELSFAELNVVLETFNIKAKWENIDPTVFILDINSEVDLEKIFPRLGGFIKYGEQVGDSYDFIKKFSSESHDSKVNFALSSYSDLSSNAAFKLGMEIKSFLKDSGISSRYVSKRKDKITSTPLLEKNKVLEKGFELCLFRYNNKSEWGRTIMLQDYESFSKRDYGRPDPNKQKGMLPPKLARIMVNLAGQKLGNTIWDPFCGSGTVLQESLILGYNTFGSDSDEKSVSESIKNLQWLKEQYEISTEFEVFHHDATHNLRDKFEFDAIVTEPYLGPVLRSVPNKERIDSITDVINGLYSAFLNNVSKYLKKDSKIVIVVPGYKSDNGWINVEVEDFITDEYENITDKISGGKNLHWDRPNSIIRRQIKILNKK